jgi:hypothetical protein
MHDSNWSDLDRYKSYADVLVSLVKEQAFEVKQMMIAHPGLPQQGRDFLSGQLFSYYRVISWMQQEARHRSIPWENIGLDDINPDQDLIIP